ncbi:hypothetical protein ACFL3S_06595 [Gemmatimonadota bacterium]
MRFTTYEFKHCVGAMYEMSTTDARKILPAHLHPLEVQHTRSVLAVLAFQFTGSEVGPYDEVVLSVVTPPRVEPGKPLPKAAFFPFMLATSTEAARNHAIERWSLPHFMKDLDFSFEAVDGLMTVSVVDDGSPVLKFTINDHAFQPMVNSYHCFMVDGEDRLKVNIFMEAPHSQHEEETGELILFEHPMTEALTISEVSPFPFREEWYQAGVQTFEEVERT